MLKFAIFWLFFRWLRSWVAAFNINKKEKEDRISQLPDDILAQILYFLPSKDAAATTVLSSSWKHIFWSYATRLNIDISANHNVEPAIQLFEALFNCKQLISARITTNYFHLPDNIYVPKLIYLHLEIKENIGSLMGMSGYGSYMKMKNGGLAFQGIENFLSADNHLVLYNSKIPREEYFSEIATLLSLRGLGSATEKSEGAAFVYLDRTGLVSLDEVLQTTMGFKKDGTQSQN